LPKAKLFIDFIARSQYPDSLFLSAAKCFLIKALSMNSIFFQLFVTAMIAKHNNRRCRVEKFIIERASNFIAVENPFSCSIARKFTHLLSNASKIELFEHNHFRIHQQYLLHYTSSTVGDGRHAVIGLKSMIF
jgi:hypothetical protein